MLLIPNFGKPLIIDTTKLATPPYGGGNGATNIILIFF
jgi:hypothetical protein